MPKLKNKKPDSILLGILLSLVIVGIIALVSASIDASKQQFGTIYGFMIHQAIYGLGLGGIMGLIFYLVPYGKIKQFSLPMFGVSLILMVLLFVPQFSLNIRGAQRWLDFGFLTFQPSELIKFTFVVYLAAWLSSRKKEIATTNTLVPFLIFVGMIGFLFMLQPDLSTFGIVAITAGVMYFIAGASIKHIAALSAVALGVFAVLIKTSAYRFSRVFTLLNPQTDPLGVGYQINQLLIAVGAGGIFGSGPFQGIQKNFIPIAMSDSIFAVWAEETGFIGGVVLVVLFLAFAWRGLYLALNKKDSFVRLSMIGIIFWIFMQASVNIASIIGIFPLTGVTIPYISYGSSSLVVTMMASGFLLQLSKQKNA